MAAASQMKVRPAKTISCPNCDVFGWVQLEPEKLKQCSKCKVVQYCSTSCQREHWKLVHKQQCEELWGRVEEAREAHAAGADPNARGGLTNSTCLMVAALGNHDGVVELLLSTQGIQVNAKNVIGCTALHKACDRGSLASLALIVSTNGVLLNERSNIGDTPIMWGIRNSQTQAVLQMAAVPDVCLDVKDNQGRSLEGIANL